MTTSTTTPARSPLTPVQTKGWRGGLRNLVRKELGQWWTTRTWWVQTLLWVLLLNGITTAVMLEMPGTADQAMQEAMQTFLLVAATAIGIGVVLTIQGAVVGEKELGTAAWVMSKPASRISFVLAKLIAHSVGFMVTALLVPSIVFLVEARLLMSAAPIDYRSFGIAVAVLALSVVFYVILTIALGTMFKGRGPVAGIGIGLILAGQFFKGMLPLPLVMATPWLLGDVASSFAIGTQPEYNRTTPIMATVIASVLLIGLALWRFEREEF